MTDESAVALLNELVVEGIDEDTGAAIVHWRTPKQKSWTEVDAKGEAVVKYLLGGREYELKTSSNCFTCQSDYRHEIESALLRSYSYQRILESLPDGHGLTSQGISNHFRKHMPVQQSIRRAIQEADARDRGLDIEGFEGALANHVTLGKLVIQAALERMVDGELQPDLKDALAFSRMMVQLQKADEADEAVDDLQTAWSIFWEEAVAVMSPTELQVLGERINSNPRTKMLESKMADRKQQSLAE